jgi:hypothetical protein
MKARVVSLAPPIPIEDPNIPEEQRRDASAVLARKCHSSHQVGACGYET